MCSLLHCSVMLRGAAGGVHHEFDELHFQLPVRWRPGAPEPTLQGPSQGLVLKVLILGFHSSSLSGRSICVEADRRHVRVD